MESDRRSGPRYPFIAEAEVTESSSDTKFIAKTSDLSIGGCFFDMLNSSPEGTNIRVKISHKDTTFTAPGRVIFVLRDMGMRVVFGSVEEDQLAILQKWISELSRAE
jgi:PilZ domain